MISTTFLCVERGNLTKTLENVSFFLYLGWCNWGLKMELAEISKKIEETLSFFNTNVFKSALPSDATEKRIVVRDKLQIPLKRSLERAINNFQWEIEKKFEGYRDSVDIYGCSNSDNCMIIIEIDAARADQIAKKIVSRFYHLMQSDIQNVIYVALCYPGTDSMNLKECEKYLGFGRDILGKIYDKALFISAFVSEKDDHIQISK